MTLTSLFAGIGGFEAAFSKHGVKPVASVEINKNCQAILRRHFPHTHIYSDVTKCGTGKEEKELEDVDIITFGFP